MTGDGGRGPWLEFFDREVNVVKAFAKKMYPSLAGAIESLQVEVLITVYQIRDETERINNLTNATNGKPIRSTSPDDLLPMQIPPMEQVPP